MLGEDERNSTMKCELCAHYSRDIYAKGLCKSCYNISTRLFKKSPPKSSPPPQNTASNINTEFIKQLKQQYNLNNTQATYMKTEKQDSGPKQDPEPTMKVCYSYFIVYKL